VVPVLGTGVPSLYEAHPLKGERSGAETYLDAPTGHDSRLAPMRVLVTGGAGFIGSHVADALLARGHDVRVLDSLDSQVHDGRPGYLTDAVELVEADVRDRDAVARSLGGVDRVVHLAAAVGVGQSMYEIERYTSINTLGAAVLLEGILAVRDRIEKAVVASSMSIYGEGLYRCDAEDVDASPRPRDEAQLRARDWEPRCPSCGAELRPIPTTESTPITPESIYAVGKRDHEEMLLVTGRAYGLPATALRFFNVYGPRQALSNPYTGVAAIFSARLLNGRPPVIFEDGHQSRDFVHVSDVAAAVVAALEPGASDGEAINVGTGRPTSVLDVAHVLGRELGVEGEPEIRNVFRAGDIRHCFADVSLARELLGYEPVVTFDDGMRELVGWLAGSNAVDRVEDATAALEERGLTV
jgi:dTDP-L-rhamnose 4-epimerase